MLNSTFLVYSQKPRHVNMTSLSHDENMFHIRSFHASRRREPNSIDVLCAYYFLGCLILFICHCYLRLICCVSRVEANIVLVEDLGLDIINNQSDSDNSIAYIAAC
jgi:hypothetical protein